VENIASINGLHSVISQETTFFITTIVRTSNPITVTQFQTFPSVKNTT
jgi:hypothetical protein